MTYIASVVVFAACVKLLSASGNPRLSAGVFTAGKIAIALFLGGGAMQALIIAVVIGAISFAYFWLLDRVEGSGWWWLVLVAGVLLLM